MISVITLGIMITSFVTFCVFMLSSNVLEYNDRYIRSARAEYILAVVSLIIGLTIGGIAAGLAYKNIQADSIVELILNDGTKYSEQSAEIEGIYDKSTRANPSRFNVEKSDGSSIEVSKAHVKKVTYADGTVKEMK